jgi:ABC-type dipeptide/oligopeptide/nickel transport system ATPase component/ABC-type dipeptide/oligopeptide/nickel transport system permease subunit
MSATDTELPATATALRKKSRSTLGRLLRNPVGAISLAFLLLVMVCGVFAGLITNIDPNFSELLAVNARPFSPGHLLGADASGRDTFARLLYGTRATMTACAIVLVVSLVLGVTAGLVAGYYRGRVEAIMDFIADVIMSLPGIVLLIALYAVTGPNMNLAMTIFGVIIAPTYFRLVRAVVVSVRSELYVDAAKVVGLSDARILSRHILWAVRGPVTIHSAGILAAGIAIQAGVSFIGLGDPTIPSWGTVLGDAFANIYRNPTGVIWPSLLITLSILALVLLGNALRDAMQAAGSTPRMSNKQKRRLAAKAARAGIKEPVSTPAPPAAAAGRDDCILSIRDLRMGYPNPDGEVREVLHGIDLDVHRGEVHGLVGESGSGKSQIAFATLGILPREAVILGGSISLLGEDLLADKAAQQRARGRRIAYIPQEPMSNLDPAFTIGAQLIIGLRAVRKMSKREARAHLVRLLERVGIRDAERVMKLYPHEISGGMAQRVLICGAVAADPEIIVADEPTTALDVTVQAEVLELLRELTRERGLALVLVTHNLGVVADLCETVSVMREGRVVERGDVHGLFESPQQDYTKNLLVSSKRVEMLEN